PGRRRPRRLPRPALRLERPGRRRPAGGGRARPHRHPRYRGEQRRHLRSDAVRADDRGRPGAAPGRQPGRRLRRRPGISSGDAGPGERTARHDRQHRGPHGVSREHGLLHHQIRAARSARGTRGGVSRHRRSLHPRLPRRDRHHPLGPGGPRQPSRLCASAGHAPPGGRGRRRSLRRHPRGQRARGLAPPQSRALMGPLDRRGRCAHVARLWTLLLSAAVPATAVAQQNKPAAPAPPPLPDSAGWGVHVLAAARDAGGSIWLGTYGRGLLRLRPGATAWDVIRHDSSTTSLSWDYVQAVAFGPRGEVWYGTVGNGWGLSVDGGQTWRNWGGPTLGPEWQYVAPDGIAVRGDTTVIATADGLQLTTDDGARVIAIVDSAGPESLGPADTAVALLTSEYVRRVTAERSGWLAST